MLAYIWNEKNRLPHEIYDLPDGEKELVYQATLLRIEEDKKNAGKGKGKGGRRR